VNVPDSLLALADGGLNGVRLGRCRGVHNAGRQYAGRGNPMRIQQVLGRTQPHVPLNPHPRPGWLGACRCRAYLWIIRLRLVPI